MNMKEILEKILISVNEWLKFAEAKNAANLILVFAAIEMLNNRDIPEFFMNVLMVLFLVSGYISLLSFIPKMGKVYLNLFSKKKPKSPNLIFFGDISCFSGIEYLDLLYEQYNKEQQNQLQSYEIQLSDEIVYNAAIAKGKNLLFTYAVRLDIIAFLVLIIRECVLGILTV